MIFVTANQSLQLFKVIVVQERTLLQTDLVCLDDWKCPPDPEVARSSEWLLEQGPFHVLPVVIQCIETGECQSCQATACHSSKTTCTFIQHFRHGSGCYCVEVIFCTPCFLNDNTKCTIEQGYSRNRSVVKVNIIIIVGMHTQTHTFLDHCF